MSFSLGGSKSKSSSKPLTPDEVAGYYAKLDQQSGGRLSNFARQGTEATEYNPLTTEELQNLGGAGATRLQGLRSARAQAIEELGADPSLTTLQKYRGNQLTNEGFADRIDAVNKETEAFISSLAANERAKDYSARAANARLSREDMEALASIFFGGKGQKSDSSSWGFSTSGSFAKPGG